MVSLGRQLADVKDAGDLCEQIAAWERQDRHLWRWEANDREQLTLRRRDAYRAIAALLTDCWPHALLETPFVGYVLRRRVGEQRDDHQTEQARVNARLAAPAERLRPFARPLCAAAAGHRDRPAAQHAPAPRLQPDP